MPLVAIYANPSLPNNTELIKKSVVFIYEARSPTEAGRLLGTGFIVGIPLKSDPTRTRIVLVTARHSVDPQWAGCNANNPEAVFIRVNKKDYDPERDQIGVDYLYLSLTTQGKRKWFFHTDDKVDVAVIVLDGPELFKRDVNYIPFRDFGTNAEIKDHNVGIGDSIVSAGVVGALAGANRNYPAFKFGKISSIPSEPVQVRCCPAPRCQPVHRRMWFLAANFVRGNSGSPVFLLPIEFKVGPGLKYVGPRPVLLGMISSTIGGADLGGMVPVEYIYEVFKERLADVDLYRGKKKEEASPTQ